VAGRGWLLFYDADCGLCTFFRNWVHRLDLRHRVRSIPLGSREADPYLARLGHDRRYGSMHTLGPDGNLVSEGRAVLRILGALPMLGGFSRLLRSGERGTVAAELAYTALVTLRIALSR